MKQTLIIIFFLSATIFKGQTVKTYSGPYENGYAEYQYYENENNERILHGNFSAKIDGYNITGTFKNNKRDGQWKATAKFSNPAKEGSFFLTQAEVNYKSGKLDGFAFFKKTESLTNKTIKETSTFFRNNAPSKFYKYMEQDAQRLTSVTLNLKLTNDGFADSTYILQYKHQGIPYELKEKFENGFLYSTLYRNMSNGEIINRSDYQSFNEIYFKNKDSITKISIIPKFIYKSENDIPFDVSAIQRSCSNCNFIENIPVVATRGNILFGSSQSNWDLLDAIDFWGNEYKPTSTVEINPFFKLKIGAEAPHFLPTKEINIHMKKLKKINPELYENIAPMEYEETPPETTEEDTDK